MFYCFCRQGLRLKCEVRMDVEGTSYELIVNRPDGATTVERFGEPPALNRRWRDLERALLREGWHGPHIPHPY